MNPESVTVIAVQVAGVAIFLIKGYFDRKKADAESAKILSAREADLKAMGATREQDRLDREQERVQQRLDDDAKEARHLKAIAAVAVEGGQREQRIIKKIDDNTSVNVEALNAANGLTAKIAASTKLVETAVSAITARPQQVEIVNTPDHSVPVSFPNPES